MTAKKSKSGTTVAATVTYVKFPAYYSTLHVVNRSSDQQLWVRSDGIDPTVAGDDCYPVLPQQDISFVNGILTQEPVTRVFGGTQVALISSGICAFTVWAS